MRASNKRTQPTAAARSRRLMRGRFGLFPFHPAFSQFFANPSIRPMYYPSGLGRGVTACVPDDHNRGEGRRDEHGNNRRAQMVPPEQGKNSETSGPVGAELERVDLVVTDFLLTGRTGDLQTLRAAAFIFSSQYSLEKRCRHMWLPCGFEMRSKPSKGICNCFACKQPVSWHAERV